MFVLKFEDKKSITFGANWSLTNLISKLGQVASHDGFGYCTDVVHHLQKVANHPVRNVSLSPGKHGCS